MTNHLSDQRLDALRLGLLDSDEQSRARVHLDGCEVCRHRADTLEADAAAFDIPLDVQATIAASKNVIEPRGGWGRITAAVMTVAAAAVLFAVWPGADVVRTKGASRALELFIVEGQRVAPAPDRVPTGATLRLRFDPEAKRYVRIWWGGQALFPAANEDAVIVEHEGPQWIRNEIILDDDPSDETLDAVFCDGPVGNEARLNVPDGCKYASVVVMKKP